MEQAIWILPRGAFLYRIGPCPAGISPQGEKSVPKAFFILRNMI